MIDNKYANWFHRVRNVLHKFISTDSTACIVCRSKKVDNCNKMKLCSSCYSQIAWIRQYHCEKCGRYEACIDCARRDITHFQFHRSAVQYTPAMKTWLARYKYRGDERLRFIFGEMLYRAYQYFFKNSVKFDYITYVPLSDERSVERGFNQAEQLAVELGKIAKIPVVSMLSRNIHTEKQSLKGRQARLANLQAVFSLKLNIKEQPDQLTTFKHGNILIIDDVYTTGSTMNECAKILKEQFNVVIYGLTWAR